MAFAFLNKAKEHSKIEAHVGAKLTNGNVRGA